MDGRHAIGHLVGILSIDDIVLRAVDEKDRIAPADFVAAVRLMCSQPGVEPAVDLSDTLRRLDLRRSNLSEQDAARFYGVGVILVAPFPQHAIVGASAATGTPHPVFFCKRSASR